MHVFLTGGTGFIGAVVLERLVAGGHDVTALVRSDASAQAVTEHGATALRGDITDTAWLQAQLEPCDAAIHAASPGDETSAAVDASIARAAVAAFGGSQRRYVHTGGIWVWGSNPAITEESPFDPPALTAWREEVERIALDSDVATLVLAPSIVHGRGKGIPNLLAQRHDDGSLHTVGDGTQHWPTVHVDDLADLYVRALEGDLTGYLLGASGENPTVRELVDAAARGAEGDVEVRTETPDESRERLTPAFADALMLDQVATGARARELGWTPTQPTLVEELAAGAYAS